MSILAAAIVPLQPIGIPKTPVVSATGGGIGDAKTSLAPVGIPTNLTSSKSAAVDIALAVANGGAGAAQGTSIASGAVLPATSSVPSKPGISGTVINSAAAATGSVPDAAALPVSDGITPQPTAQTSPSVSKNAKDSSSVVVGAEPGQIPGTQATIANPTTAQTLMNNMSRTLALKNVPKPVVPGGEVGSGATSTIANLTFSKPVALSLPIGIAPQPIASGAAQVAAVASGTATTPLNSASNGDTSPSAGTVIGGFANTAVVKGPGQTGSGDTNTGAGQGQSQGHDTGGGTQQSSNFGTVGSSPAVSAPGAVVASTASTATSLQDSTAARIAVANQVAQQIENQRLQGGTGRFVVNLHPAELGNVQVTVSQSRGVITARLVAETSQAQHALENGRQHLAQAFETRGIKVQSLQISLTSGGAGQHGAAFQTPQQSTLAQQQKTARNSSTSGVVIPAEQSGVIPISSIGSVVGSNSMLDYRA
jgi:flagellar hook-length control protein FliK